MTGMSHGVSCGGTTESSKDSSFFHVILGTVYLGVKGK